MWQVLWKTGADQAIEEAVDATGNEHRTIDSTVEGAGNHFFKQFDEDASGTLDEPEVQALAQTLGRPLTEKELEVVKWQVAQRTGDI